MEKQQPIGALKKWRDIPVINELRASGLYNEEKEKMATKENALKNRHFSF